MTEPQPILFDRDGPVARLTLNRPKKRNAFDDELLESIDSALMVVESDPDVRVLLLSGNGPHFSSGADLNWMQRSGEMDEAANRADALAFAQMLARLDRLPLPTIAVVRGGSYGGAVGLVAACDIVVCDATATFALTEVRLGLVPSVIGPYVVRAVGERWARRLMLTAEALTAEQAQSLGLVHEIADDPDARADTLVAALLAGAPGALADAKALIRRCAESPIDAALTAYTAEMIAHRRASQEGREGMKSFFGKHRPSWLPRR